MLTVVHALFWSGVAFAAVAVTGHAVSQPAGILAGDGVHPNAVGRELIADLIADGIVRALRPTGGGPQ
jgi:lysophospholipase L1-like esterase